MPSQLIRASLLALLIFLVSCAEWNLKRAAHHTQKAIDRGATIERDTTFIHGDTIINTYWKDSVLYVDRTITDTIYLDGIVSVVTKKDKRIARRDKRREDKFKYKLAKKEIKQKSKFWRGFFWGSLFMLIVVIVLYWAWKKFLRFFFRR